MDTNSSNLSLYSPVELVARAGAMAKTLRLAQGLRQEELARKSGLSLATVRRFEANGQVAFEAVARIAIVLRAETAFANLFPEPPRRSIDDALGGSTVRRRAS